MNSRKINNLSPEFQQRPLTAVCKKYPEIVYAYLFGSCATGEQTAMSDVDLALYHNKKSDFSLKKLLLFHGDCCRAMQRNDIDILVLNTTKNLILLNEIITKGKIRVFVTGIQEGLFSIKISISMPKKFTTSVVMTWSLCGQR